MSTATLTTAPPFIRSRGARWSVVALQVVLAVIYVMAASAKVTLDPTAVAGFAEMGFGPAGTVTIGVIELAAALGLLIPRLAGLAATGCVALMVGAVGFTVATMGAATALFPAAVLALAVVVAGARRHETAALVRHPRRTLLGR
ncbi:hypothetical protein GCM10023200_00100 [Actinomycetospora chlora]|uniref:DoxX-like protein n=1 Tax=Actinomycetospora chlora TaxID=663608 RepID=A0ABP9A1H8_9PSEU